MQLEEECPRNPVNHLGEVCKSFVGRDIHRFMNGPA